MSREINEIRDLQLKIIVLDSKLNLLEGMMKNLCGVMGAVVRDNDPKNKALGENLISYCAELNKVFRAAPK